MEQFFNTIQGHLFPVTYRNIPCNKTTTVAWPYKLVDIITQM